jgi:hypothetical protein
MPTNISQDIHISIDMALFCGFSGVFEVGKVHRSQGVAWGEVWSEKGDGC